MSDHIVIIGVDPGNKTGIALYSEKDKEYKYKFDSIICIGMYQTMLELEHLMSGHYSSKMIVICEKYIVTQKTARLTQQPEALKVTGAVEYLCLRQSIQFEQVQSSISKKIGNTDLLKQLNWYKPVKNGMDDHNNAASLVIAGLAQHRPATFLSLVV